MEFFWLCIFERESKSISLKLLIESGMLDSCLLLQLLHLWYGTGSVWLKALTLSFILSAGSAHICIWCLNKKNCSSEMSRVACLILFFSNDSNVTSYYHDMCYGMQEMLVWPRN